MTYKRFDAGWLHSKRTSYNYHKLHPYLDLPSRAAWALGFEAGRRRMDVSTLISSIVESWASAWEEQLGPTDRLAFERSIPKQSTRASE